jgi:hypothetical protein
METETQSSDEVDAYWRRRVVALGAVLASVGLVVWACSGSDGDGARTGRTTTVRNAAAIAKPAASAMPQASAQPGVQPGTQTGTQPTVTVTKTAQVTVHPTPERRAGDACDARDVVVNFAATKSSYGKGERPQFRLSVVNTGRRACTFGVGPRELQVQISSGPDRIWSSAQCFGGTGSSIQLLQRGIPYGGVLEWDRHRSAPASDCSASRLEAQPGTYTAFAKGGGIKTKRQVFRLH